MFGYVMSFILGVVFTLLIVIASRMLRTFGVIEIDTSKDDKAIYRLNYTKDPFDVPKYSHIIFKVYKTSLNSIDESVPPVAKK